MVFKFDFEKAFESIRWDYLQDILKMFGFGDKWCGWIFVCLNSAMRSVLVNGSPTSEFQFHKGLKQGDPLSPFLFILIMESFHLSFSKVTNAGLFSGIPIDSSLTLSHIFFADDAIFIGKWDSLNMCTIVNVLKCFHLASGLKINFHKCKLIRIGTRPEEVNAATTTMGCSIFTTPFVHLGVKVGGVMSRIKSWDDVVAKVSSRLSKWKLKTLSIGGRLTLIKSLVLTSILLYHMSIIKVPSGVFIKAIYGEDGALNSPSSLSKRSPWLDIIRELIDDSKLPKEEVATRWVKVMPIKINVFAWRVRLDKLSTRLNLSLKGIDISTIVCPLCHASIESGSHIFFSCPMARHLWMILMHWWELGDIDLASYGDWLLWLNSSRISKRLKEILEGVCYVKWWLIWRFRNWLLFGATNPHCYFKIQRKQKYLQELAPKYYGPFKILARIGQVAYKLDLLVLKYIQFFMCPNSQFNKFKGDSPQFPAMLPQCDCNGLIDMAPFVVLDKRMAKRGNATTVYVLVQWVNGIACGQAISEGGSIDMSLYWSTKVKLENSSLIHFLSPGRSYHGRVVVLGGDLFFMAFLVVLVEADNTLEFAPAAYGGRMVKCENLSPQQPPRTHPQERWPEFQADNEK
ncbi:RNA-directed DNA polymerase, eukaryota [Tanacetum coccineum]